MQLPSELETIVHDVRAMYLSMLSHALDTEDTAGSCLYASVFLSQAINRYTSLAAKVRGGDGEGDGGYVDAQGVSHGHYWVEARGESVEQAWVLDVTADQFGAEPVVMLPLATATARYRPGNQALVDEHAASALTP